MANFWILCGLLEHYVALRQRAAAGTDATATVDSPAFSIGQRFPLASRALPGRYGRSEDTPPEPPPRQMLDIP
jgi:hypothetical protein